MEITSRRMTPEEAERFRRDDAAFRKSNQMMCDRRDELVQQYPDQWVGLHHSLGVLHSDTYQGIYQELKDHQFPEAQTAIALLEKNPRITTVRLNGLFVIVTHYIANRYRHIGVVAT